MLFQFRYLQHSRIFLCISCLSSYQRFSNPGMIAFVFVCEYCTVCTQHPFVVAIKTNSYSCAALISHWSGLPSLLLFLYLSLVSLLQHTPNYQTDYPMPPQTDFLCVYGPVDLADVITRLICPMMVSGPMFNALITLGYSELMST